MGKQKFSDIALRLALEVWDLDTLHFGDWEGLEVTKENIPKAQEQYTEQLLSHIPEDVETVLDVGCGTGTVAKRLIEKGYRVEGLAPDPELIDRARERVGDEVPLHVSIFEEFETDKQFDLVLMSESCQYIKSRAGLTRAAEVLVPGGKLLIADVFRHRPWPRDKPYISKAGHNIDRFLKYAKERDLHLEKRIDITDRVGPTLDLYDEFLRKKALPMAEAGAEVLRRTHPIIFRVLRWFFGKRLLHVKKKYSHQDLETFREYRAYLTLMFRKGAKKGAASPPNPETQEIPG